MNVLFIGHFIFLLITITLVESEVVGGHGGMHRKTRKPEITPGGTCLQLLSVKTLVPDEVKPEQLRTNGRGWGPIFATFIKKEERKVLSVQAPRLRFSLYQEVSI